MWVCLNIRDPPKKKKEEEGEEEGEEEEEEEEEANKTKGMRVSSIFPKSAQHPARVHVMIALRPRPPLLQAPSASAPNERTESAGLGAFLQQAPEMRLTLGMWLCPNSAELVETLPAGGNV